MSNSCLLNIEEFNSYLLHIKRLSANTAMAYKQDLEQFNTFALNSLDCNQNTLNHHHIRHYISNLSSNKISPKSIQRKLSALRTYFKFLNANNMSINKPFSKVKAPKIEKRIVKDIPAIDLFNLFKNYPWHENTNGNHHYTLLLTFYTCGLRLSEIIELKINDLDFAKQEMRVLGKGNKWRIIPMHPELSETLRQYTHNRIGYVFTFTQGEKLYPMLINRIVNHYLKLFSTASKTNPHVLRHSFATHLLNNGANLIAIKDLLGHSNLASTQVYTKNDINRLKQMHQYHPREK